MRELIARICEIEEELKNRGDVPRLRDYNKGPCVHEKQLAFHRCQKRNRWVFGGNRTGKTECGAVEAVWMARGNHPYRKNRERVDGWVVSLSTQVQRDVAQKKVLSYLNPRWIVDIVMLSGRKDQPESGVIDRIVIRNVFGKESSIGFKSCDQGREKFQGTSLDFVWFDEEPPLEIYEECRMRVIDRKGELFGTMTPLKGRTWVYEEIYLNEHADEQVWCEEMEWMDNPFLDREEIDQLTRTMSSEELESRRYGKFRCEGGLVYPEFDPCVHVIEPFDVPREWYENVSIDPGLNNPLSCHFYAVDYDGNVYVIAEHYEAGKDVLHHAERIRAIAKRLDWPCDGQGRVRALIDSAAGQRTLAASKSVAELFYDCGILTDARVNKDLFAGIARVKAYLKNGEGKARLFIFSSCRELIREIKGYLWGNGDAPKKKDDHALDELRYFIMSRPEAPVRRAEKSAISKDKEKLARMITRKNYQQRTGR